MKFSAKKKRKMRKIRQKRINRTCSNMIGCNIAKDEDQKDKEVVDQAKIKGIQYLLVRLVDKEDFIIMPDNVQYAIYKIVDWNEFVELSPKRVLKARIKFMDANWRRKIKLQITDEGAIACLRF